MTTPSSLAAAGLLERVRQRLQHSLAVPIRPQALGRTGAQLWQIGSAVCLLATPTAALPTAATGSEYPALLVYDYVPGRLGAQLRAQGTYYADAAGNAWVQHPALLVSVQGCPRPAPPEPTLAPSRQVNLLRLLFRLLHEPALADLPGPALAARTGLAPAVVQQVRAQLLELELWPAGMAPATPPLSTAARYWLNGFTGCLRRRLGAQRYCLRDPAGWQDWPRWPLPPGCWWSGEVAAHHLLELPEAPTTRTLYSQLPRPQLVQELGLLPHPRGPVEVLNAFAPASPAATASPCVSPLLVYADLLAASQAALARKLHRRYLASWLPA